MSHVHEILKTKGGTIWSVSPKSSVLDALKLMAEKNLGAVLVMDGQTMAGIFTERDYARHAAKKNIRPEEIPITEMMTGTLHFVSPAQSTDECMAIMTSKHIRHLPVIESGKLVGLISIGDVVKKIIEDHKFSINQLEQYVTGDPTK
jgi:CBS domain-containing protein